MNLYLKLKNIIIICFILCILYIIINKSSNEYFTANEMKKYPQMLRENCVKSTEMMNKIKSINKKRCNKKGNTQKDTINNKRLCYDDTYKEIVSKLDTESNCVMANKLSKSDSTKSRSTKSDSTKSQNLKPFEGPDFINKFFMPAYDSNKLNYSSLIVDTPIGIPHKYRSVSPYDDVSRLSDPEFLYQLAGYKKGKELSSL
jgi:hypothetical protein